MDGAEPRERGRRARLRVPFAGRVELTMGGRRRAGHAVDLSATGLGLRLGRPPARDQAVEAEFHLPGFVVPLALSARVAWRDALEGRLGLDFGPLEPAVAELLESCVAGRFDAG